MISKISEILLKFVKNVKILKLNKKKRPESSPKSSPESSPSFHLAVPHLVQSINQFTCASSVLVELAKHGSFTYSSVRFFGCLLDAVR